MNVIGHGIDAVDRQRFEKLFSGKYRNHLSRYFTENELNANEQRGDGLDGLANRLAAKEAVMKALEHGFGDGLAFTDIEIIKQQSGGSKPLLFRKAKKIARKKGIKSWFISMSITRDIAIASAIACS